VSRGIALPFHDLGTEMGGGVGGQHHAPAALPPVEDTVPIVQEAGRERKISSPPGFDPRTVQPVASRYTDWAIPAPLLRHVPRIIYYLKINQTKAHFYERCIND
jgi:hypothetical protein